MPEFPLRIEIELSCVCNLTCSYCPRRYVDDLSGFMDPVLFKQLIDEISNYKDRVIVLHRRGESLLHPDFEELLYYCKGKHKEVQIATNGTIMTDSKLEAMVATLSFVSFSIDLPERIKDTRGVDYEIVAANIEKFLERNNGRVETQVSMVKDSDVTDAQINQFTNLWKGKVDRIRVYEEHSNDGDYGSLKRDRGERQPCIMPFYEMLVFCDGKVGRCNHDWDGEPIGDVNKDTLLNIWHSAGLQDLRRQHETLTITDETCKNCDSWYPAEKNQGTGIVAEGISKKL